MPQIFELIDSRSDLTQEYREKLTRAITLKAINGGPQPQPIYSFSARVYITVFLDNT